MKNFKSLILGSAAGMLAVAGAQAADLPVKAKPVEYVKVCSAYGAGFYYIPGTDICLRVGGFIFSDFEVNDRGYAGGYSSGTGVDRDRRDDWTSWRIRQGLILDARTNTEYGTLRSYFQGGFQWDTAANGTWVSQGSSTTLAPNWSWYFDKVFVQFAGFTFGMAQSFFDFDPAMVYTQLPNKSWRLAPLIAYTAQLGSGLSATLSMEDGTARRNRIASAGPLVGAGFQFTTASTGYGQQNYSAQFMPDFVANLRVDQAWGDAQISGALHQVKTSSLATPVPASQQEKYGYAFLGGLNFKLPQLGAGDSFQIEGSWSRGAIEYNGVSASSYSGGASVLAYRLQGNGPIIGLADAVFNGTSGLELTKAWSLNAELRHFWTPTLRSAISYGYLNIDYGATANTLGYFGGNSNQVAANLIWSPVKNLDIGTEVYWTKLKSDVGFTNGGGGTTAVTSASADKSQDWWGGNFRVTRYW